jgi:hypothetical protein
MQEPKLTQTRGAFSLACGVELNIRAPAVRVWSLLTDPRSLV